MRKNLDPRIWGPSAWTFLKHCATACDDSCAKSYKSFIELLPDVLPCEQCRNHSGIYIAENPVDTDDLVGWIERFRQTVAERKFPKTQLADAKRCSENHGPLGTVFLVLGILVAVGALVLVIMGLVKMRKRPGKS